MAAVGGQTDEIIRLRSKKKMPGEEVEKERLDPRKQKK